MKVIRTYVKPDSEFGMHNIEMNCRPKTEPGKTNIDVKDGRRSE